MTNTHANSTRRDAFTWFVMGFRCSREGYNAEVAVPAQRPNQVYWSDPMRGSSSLDIATFDELYELFSQEWESTTRPTPSTR